MRLRCGRDKAEGAGAISSQTFRESLYISLQIELFRAAYGKTNTFGEEVYNRTERLESREACWIPPGTGRAGNLQVFSVKESCVIQDNPTVSRSNRIVPIRGSLLKSFKKNLLKRSF